MRLASEARMNDAEVRRALDVAGVSDPSELNQRLPWVKKLIGENPALTRYFARNADGARQGPLQENAGYPGEQGPGKTHRRHLLGAMDGAPLQPACRMRGTRRSLERTGCVSS